MSNLPTAALAPPSPDQHGSTPAAALGVTEITLTESRTMRAATIDRTDVLDKVGGLALLPDDMHATTDGVASFYKVPIPTIESVVEGNKVELESNGRRVLKGAELREFAAPFGGAANLGLSPKARTLAVFSRRAILNVGQLLTGSEVAQQVRTYLLEVEELAAPEDRVLAAERVRAARAQSARAELEAVEVLTRIEGNASYGRAISRHITARMLGQEPDLDPADITITCDEYLAEVGVTNAADLRSARTRLGRTVAPLYRARYGKEPQKVQRPIDGVHRQVAVYTRRDLDLFDKAWAELGRHYNVPSRLDGGAR